MNKRPNVLKFPCGLAVHLRFHKRVPAPQTDTAYGVDYAGLLPGTTPDSMCGYGSAYSATSCAARTPAWMSAPVVSLDDRHAVEAGHTEQVGESLLIVDAALLKAATESRPE